MEALVFFLSSAHLLYFAEEWWGSAIQKRRNFLSFPFFTSWGQQQSAWAPLKSMSLVELHALGGWNPRRKLGSWLGQESFWSYRKGKPKCLWQLRPHDHGNQANTELFGSSYCAFAWYLLLLGTMIFFIVFLRTAKPPLKLSLSNS